jgi:hypothetical protein
MLSTSRYEHNRSHGQDLYPLTRIHCGTRSLGSMKGTAIWASKTSPGQTLAKAGSVA